MLLARRLTAIHARAPLTRRCSGSAAARARKITRGARSGEAAHKNSEAENPELVDGLEKHAVAACVKSRLTPNHNATDPFSPPKLHHKYRPRKGQRAARRHIVTSCEWMRCRSAYSHGMLRRCWRLGRTHWLYDGWAHADAPRDTGPRRRLSKRRVVNPIGVGPVGHIAFRTDDIDAFKKHLEARGIAYTDYGTRFARDWHQIFFLDPAGTIVEVHAVISA